VPWAWTAVRPRLFWLDARSVFPLLLWLVHWSWWTLTVALASLALLTFLERRGLTLPSVWPLVRLLITGAERPVEERRRLRIRCRP
jgi:intracellular multiplication protein IcmT